MKKLTIMFMIGLLPAYGTAFAQKITTDWDQDADFAKYQTYAWSEGAPAPNPIMDQRIVTAIESELAAQGIEKVDSNPDLYVSYYASAKEDKHYYSDSFGYGYGRRWGGGMGTTTTREVTTVKGTLMVDIWDAKEKMLIWRGTSTDTVTDNPEKNSKKVHKSMEKLFQKYPPKN